MTVTPVRYPGAIAPKRQLMLAAAGLALAAALAPAQARADEAEPLVSVEAVYTHDIMGVVAGGTQRAGVYLNNLDITADVDLERAVGWSGGGLHLYLLSNLGDRPNDIAGTLQGVDNIEVGEPRVKLYEATLEQDFLGDIGHLRLGLFNLNSDFYANEPAALLLHPTFGIGSELAATGSGGPSIFPSTALGLQVNFNLGSAYVRGAVFNGRAGDAGDPGGVDTKFDEGALVIAEAGFEGPTRLSLGAWRYSHQQDDVREVDSLGAPLRRDASGVYLLAEHRFLGDGEGRTATGFIRVGASDGRTSAFKGGFQAGVLVTAVVPGRSDSAFSVGIQEGWLSSGFRANQRDAGVNPTRAELGLEITYSDTFAGRISIQPDLQYFPHPGGDADARGVWVAGLRVKIKLFP